MCLCVSMYMSACECLYMSALGSLEKEEKKDKKDQRRRGGRRKGAKEKIGR